MAWYDSIRFGISELLAAGTSLYWRGKLNFLAPLTAVDNSSLGTTDVSADVSAGLISALPGTDATDILLWSGSAWAAGRVGETVRVYEVTDNDDITLDYADGNHFWVGNSTISAPRSWTLPTTGVADGDEITVSTKETTHAVTILGCEKPSGGSDPTILWATSNNGSLTFRRVNSLWECVGDRSW